MPSSSVFFLEGGTDHILAEWDPLHDVLDVVRHRGNGLADSSQPFSIHQGLVIAALFHSDRCLVGDGAGKMEVDFGELSRFLAPTDKLFQRGLRIQKKDSHVSRMTLMGTQIASRILCLEGFRSKG